MQICSFSREWSELRVGATNLDDGMANKLTSRPGIRRVHWRSSPIPSASICYSADPVFKKLRETAAKLLKTVQESKL